MLTRLSLIPTVFAVFACANPTGITPPGDIDVSVAVFQVPYESPLPRLLSVDPYRITLSGGFEITSGELLVDIDIELDSHGNYNVIMVGRQDNSSARNAPRDTGIPYAFRYDVRLANLIPGTYRLVVHEFFESPAGNLFHRWTRELEAKVPGDAP